MNLSPRAQVYRTRKAAREQLPRFSDQQTVTGQMRSLARLMWPTEREVTRARTLDAIERGLRCGSIVGADGSERPMVEPQSVHTLALAVRHYIERAGNPAVTQHPAPKEQP